MAFTSIPTPLRLSHSPLPHTTPRSTSYLSRRSRPRAQLIGMPEGFGQKVTPNDSEVLLAELRYSDPDKLPALVQNSLPSLDEDFYAYLEQQISSSSDLQERDTLNTLKDAITDIMKQLLDQAQQADVRAPRSAAHASHTEALDISSGGEAMATASYDELIDILLQSNGDSAALKLNVDASYARVDMRLLERLEERITTGGEDSAGLAAVQEAIATAMNERVKAGMESLKSVLAARDEGGIRRGVDVLARQGKVDDAFVLLVQANLEQAKQAGADQAVKVLELVQEQAGVVKEVALEPEVKLIRALLRTEESEARKQMLMEGLKARGSVTLVDGSSTAGVRVDGKRFVSALRRLIEEFGNVDEGFVLKLSAIGEESEAVARKLFDMEDKDVQDLQEEAFHKRSVSIWDLERVEMEEQLDGRDAPWEGRLGAIPEGFDEQGKMQV